MHHCWATCCHLIFVIREDKILWDLKNVSTTHRKLYYIKEGVPKGRKVQKWQSKQSWWRLLRLSNHFINGRHDEQVNALVQEDRWITVTDIVEKLDISCGSAQSIIHEDLFVQGLFQSNLQKSTNRHVWKWACNSCSNTVKRWLFCNGLSHGMKQGCTTMNLHTNVKAWSGNIHHCPEPRN